MERRKAYRCDNCSRLFFVEPETVALIERTLVRTMGDPDGQVVEGGSKPLDLCPVCVQVGEATGNGVVLTNPDGSVVR